MIYRNGKAYDSGDVHIAMFGSISYEVTEITYNTEQEHQSNFRWEAMKRLLTAWGR